MNSVDSVRIYAGPLVRYSTGRRKLNLELRRYLYKHVYYNPQVSKPNLRAVQMVEELFHFYMEHPQQIGALSRRRARKIGWPRAICDYIAGMTDRYVTQEYQRVFGLPGQ